MPEPRYGFLRPSLDAHSLGVANAREIVVQQGRKAFIADATVAAALLRLEAGDSQTRVVDWIAGHRITHLGFSYRLNPADAVELFGRLYHLLTHAHLLGGANPQVQKLFFAGLPAACEAVSAAYGPRVTCFRGDETLSQTIELLGLPASGSAESAQETTYETELHGLATGLLEGEEPAQLRTTSFRGYPEFGSREDSLVLRLGARCDASRPLTRVHVGPYLPDRPAALALMNDWLRTLAAGGLLDVASLGTSQLTQERFGRSWEGLANGGGVPINSPLEYESAWLAGRPMLLRTYAGCRDIPELAQVHEKSLNIAWHALSMWWFCETDGRGPLGLRSNLAEHLATARYIASTGKPLECNVPHHFAFRGADDVTYVLTAYLAALAARQQGVSTYVLQVMLNTPKGSWLTKDLAKARATVKAVRSLENARFRVLLQPRAGLDYFSPDLARARRQLAAVSMMMDDIEPADRNSPDLMHVVSFSEAQSLADPPVIDESLRISLAAIAGYRDRKLRHGPLLTDPAAVDVRTAHLLAEVRVLLGFVRDRFAGRLSADSMYRMFAAGLFPVPQLASAGAEFPLASAWRTARVQGGIEVVDEQGQVVDADRRIEIVTARLEEESRLWSAG